MHSNLNQLAAENLRIILSVRKDAGSFSLYGETNLTVLIKTARVALKNAPIFGKSELVSKGVLRVVDHFPN